MNFGKYGMWRNVDGVEFRPTMQGDHFEQNPLPQGMEEIRAVSIIRDAFGGSNWRRVGEQIERHQDRIEVFKIWKNEYGVEVQVRA